MWPKTSLSPMTPRMSSRASDRLCAHEMISRVRAAFQAGNQSECPGSEALREHRCPNCFPYRSYLNLPGKARFQSGQESGILHVGKCEQRCPRGYGERQMCDEKSDCQKPENLVGDPKECTPEQIKKCHGDTREHPCVAKPDKKPPTDSQD